MVLCCKLGIRDTVNHLFLKNNFNGGILLTNETNNTGDISESLSLCLYHKVCIKDSSFVSPREPRRWLGISHRKERLVCYHKSTQTGKVMSRYLVNWGTNIELYNDKFKDIFLKFDTEIHQGIKADNRGYEGSKPSSQDWAYMLE